MKYLKLLICVFIVSSLISCLNTGENNPRYCYNFERFKKADYSGIVIKKMRDLKNHSVRTVVLKNAESIILSIDTSKFFDSVLKGDSIIKKPNTDSIILIRGDSTFKFQIYFGCNGPSKTFI